MIQHNHWEMDSQTSSKKILDVCASKTEARTQYFKPNDIVSCNIGLFQKYVRPLDVPLSEICIGKSNSFLF